MIGVRLVRQKEKLFPSLFREPQAAGIDSAMCLPNSFGCFLLPLRVGDVGVAAQSTHELFSSWKVSLSFLKGSLSKSQNLNTVCLP